MAKAPPKGSLLWKCAFPVDYQPHSVSNHRMITPYQQSQTPVQSLNIPFSFPKLGFQMYLGTKPTSTDTRLLIAFSCPTQRLFHWRNNVDDIGR